MRRLSTLIGIALCVFAALSVVSCIDEEEYSDTPEGNFEALWNIIDKKYCFFDYKKEAYGLDWDEVYARYSMQVNEQMNDEQLFEVLGNMLGELKDGHVNMYASFDASRYWSWKEDYAANFSDSLYRKYIGTDYRIAGSLRYLTLDDNVGYVYCGTFESGIGSGNIDDMLAYLAPCVGLILDVRENGGGQLTYAEKLAARFTNEKTLVGYMCHKTGTGHSDFSDAEEQWIKPSSGVRWQKEVIVLTNRSVYSAANEFVKYMKCFDNVTVVGDVTGGGAGLPFSSELPNGWSIRFSACPMYDRDMQCTEFGIEPDYNVQMTDEDFAKGEDTIIEYARQLLK